MKTIDTYPKINSFFFYYTLAWHGKLRAVSELYRIFLNSFKSIVQEDWKGIETNEKKHFISDGASSPNNTLLVKDNNGTQTVSQLNYSSSWSVNHLKLLKTSTSLSGFVKLFAQQGVYVHKLYKSFYSCRYLWRRAMLEENATSLT